MVQEKVSEAERGQFGRKSVWRDIQHAVQGLVPRKSGIIKDEEGHPCLSEAAKPSRWKEHFTTVLNVDSEFNLEEINKIWERPVEDHLN